MGSAFEKSSGKYLSCFARVIPSITAPTVSKCDGFGAKLMLIFLPDFVFLSEVKPKWYLTSPSKYSLS
jgi:hypothetical protein